MKVTQMTTGKIPPDVDLITGNAGQFESVLVSYLTGPALNNITLVGIFLLVCNGLPIRSFV